MTTTTDQDKLAILQRLVIAGHITLPEALTLAEKEIEYQYVYAPAYSPTTPNPSTPWTQPNIWPWGYPTYITTTNNSSVGESSFTGVGLYSTGKINGETVLKRIAMKTRY